MKLLGAPIFLYPVTLHTTTLNSTLQSMWNWLQLTLLQFSGDVIQSVSKKSNNLKKKNLEKKKINWKIHLATGLISQTYFKEMQCNFPLKTPHLWSWETIVETMICPQSFRLFLKCPPFFTLASLKRVFNLLVCSSVSLGKEVSLFITIMLFFLQSSRNFPGFCEVSWAKITGDKES